jgi:ABC-type sugar transport system ATPase subunit
VQPTAGAFQGEVRLVEPLGKDTLLYFDHSGNKLLIAVVEGTRAFETGVCLGLTFDPQRLYLSDTEGKRLQ